VVLERSPPTAIFAGMKTLSTIAVLCIAINAGAQERIVLVPNWKVGDARNMHTVLKVHQTRNDTVVLDRSLEWDMKLKVTKSTATAFVVEMNYWDETLNNISDMHKQIGAEGTMEAPLLRYNVDKSTGKSELINWEESRNALHKEQELLAQTVKSQGREQEFGMKEALAALVPPLATREAVDDLFSSAIDAVTAVYGKSLLQRDTIRIRELIPVPELGSDTDSVTMTTLMTISNHDVPKQRIVVRSEERFAHDEVVKVMRSKYAKVMEARLQKEKDKAKARKQIEAAVAQVDIANKNHTVTTISTLTSWPMKVVAIDRTTIKEPGSIVVRDSSTTIDIKE
jgi:hypothetical protein